MLYATTGHTRRHTWPAASPTVHMGAPALRVCTFIFIDFFTLPRSYWPELLFFQLLFIDSSDSILVGRFGKRTTKRWGTREGKNRQGDRRSVAPLSEFQVTPLYMANLKLMTIAGSTLSTFASIEWHGRCQMTAATKATFRSVVQTCATSTKIHPRT